MFCFYRENQQEIMQTSEYKVIVIGESMTGKSTFVHNMFYNRKRRGAPRSTIGVEVVPVDLHGEGPKKRANLWGLCRKPCICRIRRGLLDRSNTCFNLWSKP